MNKFDLFQEKIDTSPLENFFPDYQGRSLEEAKRFVHQRILTLNPNKARRIYAHFATATGEF